MNLSIDWLSKLIGSTIDPAEAAHLLAMKAAPVDTIEPLNVELNDVVIGLVERVEQHPDADRLTVCRVNDGSSTIEVVCGAPNVAAGKKYPYAPVGSVLPGGIKLTKRKLRGVVSNGMLLSERELGLGSSHEGILELDTDAPAGTNFVETLGLVDTRIVLDVTPNRPDLLGHKGVARELGAALGLPVKLEPIPGAGSESSTPRRAEASGTVDGVEVVIDDVEGCPRYVAAVIRGIKIGRSPAWLETRLRSVGARPINNVVDATNYILYELNQPMHAFDVAKLNGPKIVVRRGKPGEKMTTLDGEDRVVTPEMTLICDAKRPVAVAGVMGGSDSEVSEDTTDILLECAYFDPKRIRKTRKALKMNTDASFRFERGTDIHGMSDAVRRAATLIRTIAGGEEAQSAVDVYPNPAKSRVIFLRPERVDQVLGVILPSQDIEHYLSAVGFVVVPKGDRLAVQVPGWRPDVTREVDLIEEVARLRGYDEFPVEMRPYRASTVPDDPMESVKARARRVMTAMGVNEARSMSLVSGEPSDTRAQAILNPMSEDESHLRWDLLGGLVRSAQRNWSVSERDIRLFEIGSVFQAVGPGKLPVETVRMACVVSGARTPPHWSSSGKSADYDMWDIKDMFESAATAAAARGEATGAEDGWVLNDSGGKQRGWAGSLSAEQPAWAAPLFGFEFDLEVGERNQRTFEPLPITPAVRRDLALVLPSGVTARQVHDVTRGAAGRLLEEVTVFDEYTSNDLDGRSVAFSLVFRAPDRTLKDKEVDKAVSRIVQKLSEKLGVERRQS